jgi:DNA N-6-adenine-methyltransferase (Dam)
MNSTKEKKISPADDKWVVPKSIIDKLGDIDMDVCAPFNRPWNSAKEHLTVLDDGMNKDWSGRVFCNPPDGALTYSWLEKCVKHRNAIALVYAKTDAAYFQDIIMKSATAVIFIKGRVKYHYTDGTKADSAPLPSMLVAFSHETGCTLEKSGINGSFIWLKKSTKSKD